MKYTLLTAASIFALMIAPSVMAEDAAQAQTETPAAEAAQQTAAPEAAATEAAPEQAQAPASTPVPDAASPADTAATAAATTETAPTADANAQQAAPATADAAQAQTPSSEYAATKIQIREVQTANALIGAQVYNESGEVVGGIEDIIVNQNGTAQMVVAGSTEFLGTGKKVAVDYSQIEGTLATGKIVAPLKGQIESSNEFSYEKSGGQRISSLLDAKLVDAQNEILGQVDNISFKDGKVDKLIIAYEQAMGKNGTAAMNFGDVQMESSAENQVAFRLSQDQSVQFEQYISTKKQQAGEQQPPAASQSPQPEQQPEQTQNN